jgi:hypothetical protein
MKPETRAWLDKLVPLLAHLKEGGKVLYAADSKEPKCIQTVRLGGLMFAPENYSIHVEPRVIYMNEYKGMLSQSHYFTKDKAGLALSHEGVCQVRFIEDLNWKPDLDADHHLPDHTPPHLSKQATDYMKTV